MRLYRRSDSISSDKASDEVSQFDGDSLPEELLTANSGKERNEHSNIPRNELDFISLFLFMGAAL